MGRPKINTSKCINGCDRLAITKLMCHSCYKKNYYLANIEKESNNRRIFNRLNNKKIAKRKREREKYDINYRLANRLRHRLTSAIKGGGSITYLGCSIEELRQHLESQFESGMTWNNHTKFGWHIDHIEPLSKFDLSDERQLKKACHYTNLRPLWWQDNLARRHGKEY